MLKTLVFKESAVEIDDAQLKIMNEQDIYGGTSYLGIRRGLVVQLVSASFLLWVKFKTNWHL